jgi:hypothetical protein
LGDALADPGPTLVDLVTDANALSIPPHITAAQVKGLAFAAGKTLQDGGVGKMLEMARANPRNIPRPIIAPCNPRGASGALSTGDSADSGAHDASPRGR